MKIQLAIDTHVLSGLQEFFLDYSFSLFYIADASDDN